MPPKRAKKANTPKAPKPTTTGLVLVDALSTNQAPLIDDYVAAVSEYVLKAASLNSGSSKQAQIALSAGLGRALARELTVKVPRIKPHPGELNVAGALRTARADVSEAHHLDGLRLAVEIKPVNLAVGRALWNRFGDIRAFAVNIHLKFPFAVVGGVLAIPTWEWVKMTKAMVAAQALTDPKSLINEARDDDNVDNAERSEDVDTEEDIHEEDEIKDLAEASAGLYKRSTEDLIDRLIRRLARTRRRDTEADPAHLLEAVAVIVYDPDTATMSNSLPLPGNGLRWEEFVSTLADVYDVRFED